MLPRATVPGTARIDIQNTNLLYCRQQTNLPFSSLSMHILNWTEAPEQALAEAVDSLNQGRLVAIPTDTLYGLAADVTKDEAVRSLFQAKNRPPSSPLPILVRDVIQAGTLAIALPELALRLASAYWPGPLTMVLRRAPEFHSLALAGSDAVALRVPAHDVPLAIIDALGRPITGTSANRSGEEPPRTAAEVVDQLDGDVDIVIDAGPAPVGVESTVVDLREEPPRILRAGAISRQELESATGLEFDVEE
jgi:L-threonylcarbamoyladenylate synthase